MNRIKNRTALASLATLLLVAFESEAANIKVLAKGTSAGGIYAHFKVMVNGAEIGSRTTTATETAHDFSTSLAREAIKEVAIRFTNDEKIGTEDRNLFVKSISIDGQVNPSTGYNVTYDHYARGGSDVYPGQEGLWHNGDLIFKILNLGVYYYPGWHPTPSGETNNVKGSLSQSYYDWGPWCGPGSGAPQYGPSFRGNTVRDKWCVIRTSPDAATYPQHVNFPERQPAMDVVGYDGSRYLGWYNDADRHVLRHQIRQMADSGINFVVFDYFWSPVLKTAKHAHALTAYKAIQDSDRPPGFKHALLWELSSTELRPVNLADFRKALADISLELQHPRYLKTSTGRPYLFINTIDNIEEYRSTLKDGAGQPLTRKAFMDEIRAAIPGVYLIANTDPTGHWIGTALKSTAEPKNDYRFDGVSSYNYLRKFNPDGTVSTDKITSFSALKEWYKVAWNNNLTRLPGWGADNPGRDPALQKRYIPVLTTGFDDRPWKHPINKKDAHGQDIENQWEIDASGNWLYPPYTPLRPVLTADPTAPTANDISHFAAHLKEARDLLSQNMEKTNGMAVICCWNEYGEGQILEPTIPYSTGKPGSRYDYLGDHLLRMFKETYLQQVR